MPGGGKFCSAGGRGRWSWPRSAYGRCHAGHGGRVSGGAGALGELVSVLEAKVGRMPHGPDKVEMEFRASLSGECDLWIVSGTGEAEFKVTLSWGKAG